MDRLIPVEPDQCNRTLTAGPSDRCHRRGIKKEGGLDALVFLPIHLWDARNQVLTSIELKKILQENY